jgi:hypothetical protein
MATAKLSAGSVDYLDTGGKVRVVVLLHGLVMNRSVWRHVTENLQRDHRVVVPTMPLGGHTRAIRSGRGSVSARDREFEAEFIEALNATTAGDHGGVHRWSVFAEPRTGRLGVGRAWGSLRQRSGRAVDQPAHGDHRRLRGGQDAGGSTAGRERLDVRHQLLPGPVVGGLAPHGLDQR